MIKSITLLFFLTALSLFSFAQFTSHVSVGCTIVTPINMSKLDDMNFGNLAVNNTPGTVILSTTGTRTLTGGITLPQTYGTVSAAEFIVTGVPLFTYSIVIPPSVILVNTVGSGGETMIVDDFTTNPGPAGQLGPGGSQNLNIGATAHVAAYQAPGVYVSSPPMSVTVNYN